MAPLEEKRHMMIYFVVLDAGCHSATVCFQDHNEKDKHKNKQEEIPCQLYSSHQPDKFPAHSKNSVSKNSKRI
jgi:hypothetical protein